MSTRTHQKGFTLIELLVVIAIIGLLSSVILASLSSARTKGRVAAAQETMHSVQTAAASCLNDSVAVASPVAGSAVCAGSSATYPALPSGWIYCTAASPGTAGAGTTLACNNSLYFASSAGVSFNVAAYSSADLKSITCLEASCTTATAL